MVRCRGSAQRGSIGRRARRPAGPSSRDGRRRRAGSRLAGQLLARGRDPEPEQVVELAAAGAAIQERCLGLGRTAKPREAFRSASARGAMASGEILERRTSTAALGRVGVDADRQPPRSGRPPSNGLGRGPGSSAWVTGSSASVQLVGVGRVVVDAGLVLRILRPGRAPRLARRAHRADVGPRLVDRPCHPRLPERAPRRSLRVEGGWSPIRPSMAKDQADHADGDEGH